MVEVNFDKYIIIFVKDRNDYTILNNILRDKSLLKKDGNPYKYVNIIKDKYLYINSKQIVCTNISFKDNNILLINDEASFKFSVRNLIDKMEDIFPKHKLKINDKILNGPMTVLDNNSFKDVDNNIISVGVKKENPNKMKDFIGKIQKDNGHIISPLLKLYYRVSVMVRDKRNLLGYAHIPSYFKMLNMTYDNELDKMEVNSNSDYVINLPNINSSANLNVISSSEDIPILNLFIDGVDLDRNNKNSNNKNDPYILISSRPIEVGNEKLPFFVSTIGNFKFFSSILLFDSPDYLHRIKGGINLLNVK